KSWKSSHPYRAWRRRGYPLLGFCDLSRQFDNLSPHWRTRGESSVRGLSAARRDRYDFGVGGTRGRYLPVVRDLLRHEIGRDRYDPASIVLGRPARRLGASSGLGGSARSSRT